MREPPWKAESNPFEEIIMCGTSSQNLPLAQIATGCDCCSPQQDGRTESTASPSKEQRTADYRVAGMTCGHCVSSVSQELAKLDGVNDVQIVLVPGGISTVTIYGSEKPNPDAVRAVIAEAGYEFAGTV
jgi:copper chaperone